MGRYRLGLEEQLEIDKLHDREVEANRTGEFDILYNNLQQQQTVKEAQAEEPIEESESDGGDAESNDAEGEPNEGSPESSDNAESQPKDEPDENAVAQEQFRNMHYSVATEDFDTVKEYAGKAAGAIGTAAEYAWSGAKYLTQLGLVYGPGIAKHLYKGVSYIFGKLAKLLIVSIVGVTKYMERRSKSLVSIKSDIAKLRQTIQLLRDQEADKNLSDVKYTNVKIINQLKISDKLNLVNNLDALEHFLQLSIRTIDQRIKDETGSIRHLTANAISGLLKSPTNLMHVKPINTELTKGTVTGYEPQSEFVVPYHYSKLLPGDAVFIAYMPKEDMEDLEDVTKAYNDAMMFFGVDTKSFKSIESIDYMTLDDLSRFLDKLDSLTDVCISHQTLYENVKRMKSMLKFSFKNYFHRLATAKDKVSLKNSLIEYIYLKLMFIDKIYLVAAMDIHDYSAKVLLAGLALAKDNIKKLS